MLMRFGLPLVAAGLLAFAVMHVTGAQKPTGPLPPPAEPARNPFSYTVAGAGIVEPQTENISIGSGVAGQIVKVYVHVGQKVKVGDPLFQLDDRRLKAELEVRRAAAASAQAELTRLESQPREEEVLMSQAHVREAEANVLNRRDQSERANKLFASRVSTEADVIARKQELRAAEALLAHSRARLAMLKAGAWEFDKRVARAALEQTKAQARSTEAEIEQLTVRALVDGEVLQVNVRPGEFAAAPSTQALIVLGNVTQLHVRVDIDEYDIHRFNLGSPAEAMLKGQPKVRFPLKFVRVEPYVVPKKSLTGANTERVDTRVLQVIYSIDQGHSPLFVGQQLDVFIKASPPRAPAEGNSAAAQQAAK